MRDDVYLLFKRFDIDNDGKLNFEEFSNLLASKNSVLV